MPSGGSSAAPCTHPQIVAPSRPIPDWTSAPCPDCGERCKHDGRGGFITVRESNALAAVSREGVRARVALLGSLSYDLAQTAAREAAHYDAELSRMWGEVAAAITRAQVHPNG